LEKEVCIYSIYTYVLTPGYPLSSKGRGSETEKGKGTPTKTSPLRKNSILHGL
jgi:hypothetical protein